MGDHRFLREVRSLSLALSASPTNQTSTVSDSLGPKQIARQHPLLTAGAEIYVWTPAACLRARLTRCFSDAAPDDRRPSGRAPADGDDLGA